jgi:hypothetical protein
VRETNALAGAFSFAREKLFTESGRKFVAGRKFDFVLDAGIVGSDDAATGGVTEKADDRRMRAGDDAEDAAFGAARAGSAAEAGNFGDDVVAVHGVFDEVAGDEEIAIEIRNGDIGNDETVTVLVENEAAFDFVAGNGFVLREFFNRLPRSGGLLRGMLLRAGSLAKKEAAVGRFFDEAALFELGEHLEEGTAAGPPDLEGAGEILQGSGSVSKL